MHCITSTCGSVLVNGAQMEWFSPSRCIRQGNLLSPYIFILCMEMLSELIYDAWENGEWNAFCVGKKKVPITHLLFADDLLLFGECCEETLEAVQNTLDIFMSCSGQKVNRDKSKLYVSPNTTSDAIEKAESILEVKTSKDLGMYLG